MKKLILSLNFAFLAFFAFGITAQAQLESPVPLSEVMPTTANSSLYGVPWSQSTNGFAFSYTIDFDRCACAGGYMNVAPKAMQECLNGLGFNVSHSGPGSHGMETNCVGAKTVDALDRFQQYFGFTEKAMNHFGDYTAFGGEVTQVLMNHLCFGESGANSALNYTPGTTQSTVVSSPQGGVAFSSRGGGSRGSTTIIYENGGGNDDDNGGGSNASVTLNKRVVPTNAESGDQVTFYFDLATNNGGSHTGITIDDGLSGLGQITCTNGDVNGSITMAANSTLTCSATYTASSTVTNTASVTSADDNTPNTGSATLTVGGGGGDPIPDASITKNITAVNGTNVSNPGTVQLNDVITYEIEVCNNGQAGSTLPVVTISDPLYTGGSYTTGSTLAFGACDTEVYTYTASAAGTLPNTAQVTTSGYETSDSANTSVEGAQQCVDQTIQIIEDDADARVNQTTPNGSFPNPNTWTADFNPLPAGSTTVQSAFDLNFYVVPSATPCTAASDDDIIFTLVDDAGATIAGPLSPNASTFCNGNIMETFITIPVGTDVSNMSDWTFVIEDTTPADNTGYNVGGLRASPDSDPYTVEVCE